MYLLAYSYRSVDAQHNTTWKAAVWIPLPYIYPNFLIQRGMIIAWEELIKVINSNIYMTVMLRFKNI